MYDYLIVGSGLYGAVFAHEAKKLGKKCLVVEKRSHIAGNIYTKEIEGIQVHQYGAHIFHTSNKKVWEYIQQFAEFNRYTNSPVAYYKGEIYNMPFNMNTFHKIWGVITPKEAKEKIQEQIRKYGVKEPRNLEEQAVNLVGKDIYEILVKGYTEKQWGRSAKELPPQIIKRLPVRMTYDNNYFINLVGKDIYEILVKGYTEKQWGRSAKELPPQIIKRLPVRMTYDNNYFNDLYQGIPVGGYTQIIEKMIDGVEVRLNVDYLEQKKELDEVCRTVVYTGPVDAYFNYKYGELEYRSVRFETEILDEENYQGNAVVNYTDYEVPYTRIIEHKHFEFGTQPKTVISREYSAEWKLGEEPYYPVNDEKNNQLYRKYEEDAKKEERVIFGGRLGKYKYYDMHHVVEEALNCVRKELGCNF